MTLRDFFCLLLFASLNPIFLQAALTCDVLHFEPAYKHLLEHTFELKIAEAEIGMRQAEHWQAGRRPNPILNAAFNSWGRGGYWDENELFIGLSQLIELGGKRRARERVAEAAQAATSWDVEIVKCDLYGALLHAFIEVAIAQERLQLAAELLKVADEGLASTHAKTTNGKISSIEIKKAQIAQKMALLGYTKRQYELTQAKIRLCGLWDDVNPQFECVFYPIYEVNVPPPLTQLACELESNPILSKTYSELRKAWEIVSLERSRRIPNMAIQVGVNTEKHLYKDPSVFVGFEIPLPFNDRNQGNICRAEHERNQILFKQLDIANQLNNKLELYHQEWCSTYTQAMALQELVNSSAEESYQLAHEGYQAGKIDYLALLEARSTLYGLRMQYLDILAEYHHKRADTLKLTAKCCPTLTDSPELD